MRRNKYGVAPKEERTSRDGILFDSKGELKRWENLRLWQLKGDIRNLRRQVEYPLVINGETVGKYVADFVYEKKTQLENVWSENIEDYKGHDTAISILKRKMVKAIYGIEVRIIRG